MPCVKVEDLSFGYSSANLFQSVTLRLGLEPSEPRIVAVMGPSGVGKTTLLKILAGIEEPDRGFIKTIPDQAFVCYIPQEPVIFDHLSLDRNLDFFRFTKIGSLRFSDQSLDEAISILDLNMKRKSIFGLSGGEKQRVCLARSLAVRPEIILLDEPCAGIDPAMRIDFLKSLRATCDRFKILAIYVSHHPDETSLVADDILYMYRTKESEIVNFELNSLLNFFSTPPTLEIALSLSSAPLNQFPVALKDQTIELEGGAVSLNDVVFLNGATCSGPSFTLAFSPSCVSSLASGHFKARCYGQSGRYWILTFSEGDTKFLALRSGVTSPRRFDLIHRGLLFNEKGLFAGEVKFGKSKGREI